ncbi:hypothetical protein HOLleu_22879 [Holothuria leucospilota]|uniref:Uncharacterized protein n=1 Tax=Holothuria leucospilota TaxID=206669 RepID=A0A9Q1BTZ0_HOLLE|nr:hypothetical protein HOLleu_22879 [Holothuria leucospilota]
MHANAMYTAVTTQTVVMTSLFVKRHANLLDVGQITINTGLASVTTVATGPSAAALITMIYVLPWNKQQATYVQCIAQPSRVRRNEFIYGGTSLSLKILGRDVSSPRSPLSAACTNAAAVVFTTLGVVVLIISIIMLVYYVSMRRRRTHEVNEERVEDRNYYEVRHTNERSYENVFPNNKGKRFDRNIGSNTSAIKGHDGQFVANMAYKSYR